MARSYFRSSGGGYRGRRGGPPPVLAGALALLALGAVAAAFLLRGGPPAPAAPPTARPAAAALAQTTPSPLPAAPEVRGIYISGPVAGDPYMETLVALVEDTELNAVVIDVKNDEGHLTYRPGTGTAQALGACVGYIGDLPGLVSGLKGRGIYTIARIAAFKDPVLSQARPELALRGADGAPLSEGGGPAWVNPYEEAVWDYLTEIALGAAQAGFDEIQFDYVRFPTGKAAQQADYGPAAGTRSREEVVIGFLEHARAALRPQGVRVSADVFGTVMSSALDAGLIGQDYAGMARAVDYLCPMVYPSHYAPGSFGLELPDRAPYETVRAALDRSRQTLAGVEAEERAGVRAWLQAFTATWVPGHGEYDGEALRAQIQAVYDAGYTDWILWNAKNVYPADALLPAGQG